MVIRNVGGDISLNVRIGKRKEVGDEDCVLRMLEGITEGELVDGSFFGIGCLIFSVRCNFIKLNILGIDVTSFYWT